MNKSITIAIIFCLFTCSCEETFNEMPCEINLESTREFLDNKYERSGWGASPKGFRPKSYYDPDSLDCTSWSIYHSVRNCTTEFFNENYILELSKKIFEDSANIEITNLQLQLNQCHLQKGQVFIKYIIERNTLVNANLKEIPRSKRAKIERVLFTGTSQPKNEKIIGLQIDSMPMNPRSLAENYWEENPEYSRIELKVFNIDSPICKEVKYLYIFE